MELNQYSYHCPCCNKNLQTENGIKLKINKSNVSLGYIYLNPNIGNYEYKMIGDFNLINNLKYDFFCPICEEDITSEKCDLYSKLTLKIFEGITFDLLFSKVFGDHKTLIVTEENEFLKGEELHQYITRLQFEY